MAALPALDRAVRAARRGHTEAARRLLDAVLEGEPGNELALAWRARIEDEPSPRAALLRRVLEVNPDNRWAAAALEDAGNAGGNAEGGAVPASRSLDDVGARAPSVEHLQCPNCGGQVEVHPGRGPKAAVCTHCGSVLDLTSRQLEILGQVDPQFEPVQDILPGAEAVLEGERHLVTGWLRYQGWDDEDSWTWDEWQLVGDSGTARYLSYSPDEGFLLQSPVRPTPAVTRRGLELPDGLVRFHEVSPAAIVGMAGELTWRPRLGETLEVAEARRGQTHYSVERTAEEVEVVAGERLEDVTVWTALGRDDVLAAMTKRQLEAEERAARRRERARKRRRTFAAVAKIFAAASAAFVAFGALVVPRPGDVAAQASATYQSGPVALPLDPYERAVVLHDTVDLGPVDVGEGAHVATVTAGLPAAAPDGPPRRPSVDVDVAFVDVGREPVYRAAVPDLSGAAGTEVSASSRPFRVRPARGGGPLRLTLLVRREWAGAGNAAWTAPVSFPVSVEVRRVWLAGPFWFVAALSFFLAFAFFAFSRTGPR